MAQVSGQINYINPQFRDGGFFAQGDVLLRLDDRDHQADVKIAKAALLNAKQQLLEEKARGQQALADWQRLGNGKQANDLVLRKPQLAAAEAQVLSAQAQYEKAELRLERTTIIAPFDGRVLKQQVDLGQVVANNSQLAQIYATDYVEVRLPIKNNDLALMNLPRESREQSQTESNIIVEFESDLMGQQFWQGQVVRAEGAIDNLAQQLYIVAQIADPYQSTNQNAIKIGQYLTAKVTGKMLPQAMVIPNSAIYQGSYVYVVEQGALLRKDIEIRWQNDELALIDSGLNFSDELVLTPLGQVASGTQVAIAGRDEPRTRGEGNRRGKGKDKEGKRKREGKPVKDKATEIAAKKREDQS